MLNQYIWRLYLQSGGESVVDMFRRNLAGRLTEEYIEHINRMREVYCINDGSEEDTSEQLRILVDQYKDITIAQDDNQDEVSSEQSLNIKSLLAQCGC